MAASSPLDHRDDWGKRSWIEDEGMKALEEVVTWKTMGGSKNDQPPNRHHLLAKGPHKFEDDGSSLWAHVKRFMADQFLVKVVKLLDTKSPSSCIVSDGLATVRAKFTKAAINELKRTGHLDNFSEISNDAILSISRFRVKVSPSGPEDQRVTIFIDDVDFCRDKSRCIAGNGTRHFNEALPVRRLLHRLEATLRAREDTEPIQDPNFSRPSGRTRVYENGRRTQEFATQVRANLANDGFEMQHGANLAAPVAPRRKDGGKIFGTESLRRDESPDADQPLRQMGSPNAFQQLQFLKSKPLVSTESTGPNAFISKLHSAGDSLDVDDTDSSELDEEDRMIQLGPLSYGEYPPSTRSNFALGTTRKAYDSNEQRSDIPQYDGMHDENIAESRMHAGAILQPQSRAAEAGNSSYQNVTREEFEAARAQHRDQLARETKARGGRPPIPYTAGTGPLNPLELQIWRLTKGFKDYSELNAENARSLQLSSRPATPSAGPTQNTLITSTSEKSTSNTTTSKATNSTSKRINSTPKTTSSTSKKTTVTSMWQALLANPTKGPLLGPPHNQEELLKKPHSENHGSRPPIGIQSAKPTVPIDILISHTRADTRMSVAASGVRQTSQDVDCSPHDPSTPVTAASSPMSGVEPSEDEDDGTLIEWPATPEHLMGDALPPDSSPLTPMRVRKPHVARNESAFSPQDLMERHILPSVADPASAHKQSAVPIETDRVYSQAPPMLHTSTVTGEPTWTPAGLAFEMDLDKAPDTTKTNQLFSSAVRPVRVLEPSLHQSVRDRLALAQPSTLSSSNFAASPAKRCEDSSLSDLKQSSSKQLVPGTSSCSKGPDLETDNLGNLDRVDSDLPSEVHATQAEKQLLDELSASITQDSQSSQQQANSQLDAPETVVISQGNTQSSHKRRASSRVSPDRERKPKSSRFGLTQESPVSQDPAETTAMARAQFLNGKKSKEATEALPEPTSPVTSKPTQVNQDQGIQNPSDAIGAVDVEAEPSTRLYANVRDVPSSPPAVPSGPHAVTEEPHSSPLRAVARVVTEEPPSSPLRAIVSVATNPLSTVLTVEDLYNEFNSAYPNYSGSMKQFRNLCSMIMASTPGRIKLYVVMQQTSYDDFLLRYNPEFVPYNLETVSAGLNADTYDIWYLNKGEDNHPSHTKMILTNEKLETLHAAGELELEDDGYIVLSPSDESEMEDDRGRNHLFQGILASAQMATPNGQCIDVGSPSNKWKKRTNGSMESDRSDNEGPPAQPQEQNETSLFVESLSSKFANPQKIVGPRNPWKMARKVQEGSEWWRDPKSRFNEFVKGYQTLKSTEKAKESEGPGTMGVLSWDS